MIMTFVKKILVATAFIAISAEYAAAVPVATAPLNNVPVKAAPVSTGEVVHKVPLKPLLIVRFNKPDVYYKTPLQLVVDKAVSIKPAARFEVVSLVPVTEGQETARMIAEHNGKKIVQAITASGVSAERIAMKVQEDRRVSANEVHILAY
jgi:hypothetical protein